MSPAKLPIQAHQVLEIKLWKDFVINLDKRWVWNKLFIPGRQRVSLLCFIVCQSLDTRHYVCLPAREFLCKVCMFRIALVIFASLWYNLFVWILLNPRMAKCHPASLRVLSRCKYVRVKLKTCVPPGITLYTPLVSEKGVAYFAHSRLTARELLQLWSSAAAFLPGHPCPAAAH